MTKLNDEKEKDSFYGLAKQVAGETIDEFDGGSQEIGTLFAWQTIFGFEMRTAANASKHHVSFDSNFAAHRATRKSTIGMVQGLGPLPIKKISSLQTSVGLYLRECEFSVHMDQRTGLDFKPTCATWVSTYF